jgi:protocatechuate 3,4-dioxygenase beta subunit
MLMQPTMRETQLISRRSLFAVLGAVPLLRHESLAATPELPETEDNIEGPFYKAGAPERADLIDKGMPGTPLIVTGRVFSTTGEPLAAALLDFWQANAEGEYDNQGFRLRGRFAADNNGNYRVRTIVPKYYKAGNAIRPSHIHVKLSAPGFPLLTTQLYFKGAPYNYVDSDVRPSLMLTPRDDRDAKQAQFDFVLRHA